MLFVLLFALLLFFCNFSSLLFGKLLLYLILSRIFTIYFVYLLYVPGVAVGNAVTVPEPLTIRAFWTSGIPLYVKLVRFNQSTSTHNSNHAAIDVRIVQSFGVCAEIPTTTDSWGYNSAILTEIKDKDGTLSYSNETGIEGYVRQYLTDVLRSVGLIGSYQLDYQTTLASTAPNGSPITSKCDIWVVKSLSGVPIAVIEVKQPGNGRLDNHNVLGQVFDYITQLRNSFGQCEVFGIVTNLEHWRVCWLPDCDVFAAATNKVPQTTSGLVTSFEHGLARSLSCSKIYCWLDQTLPRVVASVLLKASHAQYRPVDLLSLSRSYVTFTQDTWSWGKLTAKSLKLPLTLALPATVASVRVLRQFHGGADGQVFLGIVETKTELHLVVVKCHFDEQVCGLEQQRWGQLNCPVLRQTLFKRQCLMMPFVFHVVTSGITDSVVCFKSDLGAWGRESAAAGAGGDTQFEAWSLQAGRLLSNWTAEAALLAAVEAVAERCFVHLDLKWQHVALLPVVLDGKISELKPVLIDLARMESRDSKEEAMEAMKSKVEELINLT